MKYGYYNCMNCHKWLVGEQGRFRQWVLSSVELTGIEPCLRVTLVATKSQTQDAASVTWCRSFYHQISSPIE